MPAPRKMSDEFLAECDAEARRRATRWSESLSNKELARRGGVTPSYVAQVVARMVRKYQRVTVSRETE